MRSREYLTVSGSRYQITLSGDILNGKRIDKFGKVVELEKVVILSQESLRESVVGYHEDRENFLSNCNGAGRDLADYLDGAIFFRTSKGGIGNSRNIISVRDLPDSTSLLFQ